MIRFLLRFKTLFLTCVLLSISLITMSSKINTNKFHFRTFLFSMIFNVENTALVVFSSIKNVFVNIRRIKTLELKLENTEQRLLRYRELTFLHNQLQKENKHLKSMLRLHSRITYPAHYSKIIFRDPTLLSDNLIINKGKVDGIKINMPVIIASETDNKLILIGKIIEVASKVSKVRLITAKNLFLGVRLVDTGYAGILRGQGFWNQNLALDYIPIEARPKLGEEVVTSGESDIYPPGLFIGSIQGIGQNIMEEFFQILYIKQEFNYNKLSDVFVLEYDNNHHIDELVASQYEK